MRSRSTVRFVAVLLAALALAGAWAQETETLVGEGYRFDVPRGWPIEEQIDGASLVYFVSSPGGEGGLIAAVAPLDGEERAAYEAQGLPGLVGLSTALIAELPGVQRGEPTPTTVAGVPAMGFPFGGGELSGRFVYLVADGHIYVLGSVADASGAQLIGDALDRTIASFALASTGGAGSAGGAAPANPLGGNPLGGNPLGGGGANPLAAPAFAGTFTGDGVTLTLERGGDGYVGSLTYQGQTYPVTARESSSDALTGTFVSGADSFAFELARSGDQLTLTTGSTRFTLR
jgi:hypothetical protein